MEEKNELCERKNEIYKELIGSLKPSDILPGINEFISELKKDHILIGLASVSKNAPEILNRLELRDSFDYMADASTVERSKPYPDVFIDNLINLGVSPSEAIGVEDAESGIEAIHRAGMKAVGIGNKKVLKDADVILSTSKELSFSLLYSSLESTIQ